MTALDHIFSASEQWLMHRILDYAKQNDYIQYTSPRVQDWQLSIKGLSDALEKAMAEWGRTIPEIPPSIGDKELPLTEFGRIEAQRHRERGISIAMFLGLFKYYRQTYVDLVEHKLTGDDLVFARNFVVRCFDLIEIALCSEWTSSSHNELLDELSGQNRILTNEKSKYAALIESISDPIFLIDQNSRIEKLNLAAAAFLRIGTAPERFGSYSDCAMHIPERHTTPTYSGKRQLLVGRKAASVMPWMAEDISAFWRSNNETMHFFKSINHLGIEMHVRVSITTMHDCTGKFDGAVVTFKDETNQTVAQQELKHQERLLTQSRDQLRLIMDEAPALIAYVDTKLRYQFVNKYYEFFFERPADELIGKRVPEVIGGDTFKKIEHKYARALRGERGRIACEYINHKQETRHLEIQYLPHRFEGEILGIILLTIDDTERIQAQRERERFFSLSLDMMCVTNLKGQFRHINPAFTQALGWSTEKLLTSSWSELVHPDDAQSLSDAEYLLRQGESVLQSENRYRCKDDSYRWITWNALPLPQEDTIYVIARDTTEHKQLMDKLRRMATKDSLTGADNRRQFFKRGEEEFSRARRYSRSLSVIMLDIDHFKVVNDTHGHAAGDEVLKKLVIACRTTLRQTDRLGRIGGEEFAAILQETNKEHVAQTAERLRKILQLLTIRTDAGDEITITASFGTATIHEQDSSIADLLKRADTALYQAKRAGRNRVVAAAPPE